MYIILIHGLGAHPGRWLFLQKYFKSKNIKFIVPNLSQDTPFCQIKKVKQLIKQNEPVIIIGESLGGLIAYLAAISLQKNIHGLICLVPAFANNLPFSLFDYIKIISALLIMPWKKFKAPFTPEMCTRDKAYQAIMNKNPLEQRDFSALFYGQILVLQVLAAFKKKISFPIDFLLAEKDELANTSVSQRFFSKIHCHDKMLKVYRGTKHALSIEKNREVIFKDIKEWLSLRGLI